MTSSAGPATMQRDAHEQMLLGFELAPIGLCITSQRTIVQCNDVFAQLFSGTIDGLVGQSLELLYPSHEEYERTGQRWFKMMQRNGHYADERIMKRRNGPLFWCHVAGRTHDMGDPFALAVWAFHEARGRPLRGTELTPREREVAACIVEGLTNKHMAARLQLSPRTVEMHRARLMRKLDVNTASALIAKLTN
jgi:PAS domain S-box-containing protein